MGNSDLFRQAILLAKTGEREQARRLLAQLVLDQPDHELAWLWLSDVVDSSQQRLYCLKRALEINPDNLAAQRKLETEIARTTPLKPDILRMADRADRAGREKAREGSVPASPRLRRAVVRLTYHQRLLAMAGAGALLVTTLFIANTLLQLIPNPSRLNAPAQAARSSPTATPSPTSSAITPSPTPPPSAMPTATSDHSILLVNNIAVPTEFAAILKLTLTPTPPAGAVATPPHPPGPSNTAYERGLSAYLDGDYTTALEQFDQALAHTPTLIEAHYYHGLALAALGECEEAIEAFEPVISAQSTHTAAHNSMYGVVYAERGVCFDTVGDRSAARADYNTATRLDSTLIAPYLGRAAQYVQAEQFNKAWTEYGRALKVQPDHVEVLYQRAALSQSLGRSSRALDDLNEALEINPQLVKGYVLRGQVYAALLRYPEALYDFGAALAFSPKNAEAWYQRGTVYQQLDEDQKALSDFNQALKLKPDFAEALAGRGDVYLNWGEFTLARTSYQDALSYDEHLASAAIGLGRVTLTLGSYDQAIDNFSRALVASPGNEDAMMYLGQALVLSGRYREAVNTFNQAIRAVTPAPKQAVMYEWRGRAQYEMGHYAAAIKDLSLAIARYPTGQRFYYRGLAYQAAGNAGLARSNLELSLQSGELEATLVQDALERLKELE